MQIVNVLEFWRLSPMERAVKMTEVIDGTDTHVGFGTRMRQDYLKANEGHWQRRWKETSLPKPIDLVGLADLAEQDPGHFKRAFDNDNLNHDVIVQINRVLKIPKERLPDNLPGPFANVIGLAQALPMFIQDRQKKERATESSSEHRPSQRRPLCPPLDYGHMALLMALYDDACALRQWFRLLSLHKGDIEEVVSNRNNDYFFISLFRKTEQIVAGDVATRSRLPLWRPTNGNLPALATTVARLWNTYQIDLVMTWEGVNEFMGKSLDLPEPDVLPVNQLPNSLKPNRVHSDTLQYTQNASDQH